MKTKLLSPKKRIARIAKELDAAELAEDAQYLLKLYREMVVEEDRGRRRAAFIKEALVAAEAKLQSIEAHCARKNAEYDSMARRVQRAYESIEGCETLTQLRKFIKQAKKDAVRLKPLADRAAHLKEQAANSSARAYNARKTLEELEFKKERNIYSWTSIETIATPDGALLAQHIREVISQIAKNCGREPITIIMHPSTLKGMVDASWRGQMVTIDGVRVECSKAVIPDKAIVRF